MARRPPEIPKKLFHCEPVFKCEYKDHKHCDKIKRPWYYLGQELNVFLKKDVLMTDKSIGFVEDFIRKFRGFWGSGRWRGRNNQQLGGRTCRRMLSMEGQLDCPRLAT